MPEFYMIIARQIFFPIFWEIKGGRGYVPPTTLHLSPTSPAMFPV